jgi:hypothetical protein
MADHKFKDTGLGTKSDTRPICAKFSPDIDAIIRALPNRSEFVRSAVMDALKKSGLLERNDNDE